MEFHFDKKQNFQEQITFIRQYATWVKNVPNKVWSQQQAEFLNSLYANNTNPLISPETYIKIVENVKKNKK